MEKRAQNIALIRAGLAAIICAAVAYPELFQSILNSTWRILRRSALFRASFFETVWTTGCYIVLEVRSFPHTQSENLASTVADIFFDFPIGQLFYTSIVINPESTNIRLDQRPGQDHLYRNGTVKIIPWAKRVPELFAYVGPLFLLDLTMIKKYANVARDELLRSGGYPVTSSSVEARDSLTGILIRPTYLMPSLHNFSWSSPLQIARALPVFAPTARNIALHLVSAIFIYDFLFFVPHVLLHRIPFLYSYFHETHHQHSEIQPQITNRLDLPERMLLLLA